MYILLHGADTYRSRERLRVLREAFRTKYDPTGFGTVRVDASEADPERVRTLLTNQGFFAKRRLVILERLADAPASVQSALTDLLTEAASGEDPIVVRWEERKLGARTTSGGRSRRGSSSRRAKPVKSAPTVSGGAIAPAGARVEEYLPLAGPALARWYQDAARSRGFSLTVPAVSEMVRRLGADLWSGASNLDKLSAARIGTVVDLPLVETLVVGTVPPGAFAFTDAVAERRTELALTLLTREVAAGAAPLALLAQLTWQFRILTMVTASVDTTPAALAKRLRVHPYVVQKAAAAARRFSPTEALDRFRDLLELEREFKSGHPNPALALERFVVSVGTVPVSPVRTLRKPTGASARSGISPARHGSGA